MMTHSYLHRLLSCSVLFPSKYKTIQQFTRPYFCLPKKNIGHPVSFIREKKFCNKILGRSCAASSAVALFSASPQPKESFSASFDTATKKKKGALRLFALMAIGLILLLATLFFNKYHLKSKLACLYFQTFTTIKEEIAPAQDYLATCFIPYSQLVKGPFDVTADITFSDLEQSPSTLLEILPVSQMQVSSAIDLSSKQMLANFNLKNRNTDLLSCYVYGTADKIGFGSNALMGEKSYIANASTFYQDFYASAFAGSANHSSSNRVGFNIWQTSLPFDAISQFSPPSLRVTKWLFQGLLKDCTIKKLESSSRQIQNSPTFCQGMQIIVPPDLFLKSVQPFLPALLSTQNQWDCAWLLGDTSTPQAAFAFLQQNLSTVTLEVFFEEDVLLENQLILTIQGQPYTFNIQLGNQGVNLSQFITISCFSPVKTYFHFASRNTLLPQQVQLSFTLWQPQQERTQTYALKNENLAIDFYQKSAFYQQEFSLKSALYKTENNNLSLSQLEGFWRQQKTDASSALLSSFYCRFKGDGSIQTGSPPVSIPPTEEIAIFQLSAQEVATQSKLLMTNLQKILFAYLLNSRFSGN